MGQCMHCGAHMGGGHWGYCPACKQVELLKEQNRILRSGGQNYSSPNASESGCAPIIATVVSFYGIYLLCTWLYTFGPVKWVVDNLVSAFWWVYNLFASVIAWFA
jgi:hypothetical protein